jgi:hypothetical protein
VVAGRKHSERLTLSLLQAGPPLDSDIVERSLKECIMHRENSLFYNTANGAEMGDLFMSLIHTCELNNGNRFDYLTELQEIDSRTSQESGGMDSVELSPDC